MFTSAKMKEMFSLISLCSDHLEQYINKIPDNAIIEIRELSAKYTIDVIGSCAFGIETGAFNDEESEFCKVGREMFKHDKISILKLRLQENFPKFYNQLGILFGNFRITSFFLNIIKNTMEYRMKNNIVRNDFINVIMELKRNPNMFGDEIGKICKFFQIYRFLSKPLEILRYII